VILISGYIDLDPAKMVEALATFKPLIEGALTEPGCLDYDWCPNPLIPGRIRIFERWTDEASLASHFQTHWYSDMGAAIHRFGLLGMEALKYRADLVEPVYDDSGTPRADFFTQK